VSRFRYPLARRHDVRLDAEVIDRTFVSLANDGIRGTFGVSI
jgi:hypothetical protein